MTTSRRSSDSLDSTGGFFYIRATHKNAYQAAGGGKDQKSERLYLRLLLVTDYVCGMTDSYAKRLYQEMNGII